MSTDEERRARAGQIRVFTAAACISLAAAIGFVILELTTDLNGAGGAISFLALFVLNVGVLLFRRRQRRREDS